MALKEQITEDMKTAMRAKDSARLGTIRLLLAAIFVPTIIVLAILASAARAAGPAGTTSPEPRLLVGIADQKPDMFADPRFVAEVELEAVA